MDTATLTILRFCGESAARIVRDLYSDITADYNKKKYDDAILKAASRTRADNKALKELMRAIVKIENEGTAEEKKTLPDLNRVFERAVND